MEYFNLLRPKQWIKNLFLFIPLFFSGEIFHIPKLLNVSLGFISFSLIASCVYIINDYRDIESDKKHPKKCKRPLASGSVSKREAIFVLILCLIIGFSIAFFLKPKFLFILSIYFILNLAYSFGLKNISILDVIIVATGFVLRVKCGGVLSHIYTSEWLTLMVFLLALIMAFAKRRDDVLIKAKSGSDIRKASRGYNLEFLNVALAILSAITIVSYLLYSLSMGMIEQWGTHRLYYTCLFVIAGILRYLQIAFVENESGSPTSILYKDKFIQGSILVWIISFYFIIYYPEIKIFGE
ncbi:decaprenyl-phosphate phosphoribosyltransferase [Chondrinema litorale]|uniref:decaprenyl-phosphate phosphoribosyltransferase n=1 Tax=Chondrinema litorale TaxID=2994555 RepID=UPI0025432C02|nr:decaprenyl-phosphate phosphoribosyltransferase [Chondrinema litorale]UZS00135.1 decaprenyl-phosphate phosphoribosyltransferase [Chondrinema litorale]